MRKKSRLPLPQTTDWLPMERETPRVWKTPISKYLLSEQISWRFINVAAKTDLVIVESPSKAKTIGKYLGPGYEVKASMGHVRDLPKSKIGVDIEGGFVPQYQPSRAKRT